MTDRKGVGGRPTKYDEERGEQVIALMADGYSIAGVAGKLGVCRTTIYQWAEDNPEFSHTLNVARAAASAWWEDRARDLAMGGEGNASVVIFGLKNRSAQEWRDKQSHELSGVDGGPIETEDVTKRDADAFARSIAGLATSSGEGSASGEPGAGDEGTS